MVDATRLYYAKSDRDDCESCGVETDDLVRKTPHAPDCTVCESCRSLMVEYGDISEPEGG